MRATLRHYDTITTARLTKSEPGPRNLGLGRAGTLKSLITSRGLAVNRVGGYSAATGTRRVHIRDAFEGEPPPFFCHGFLSMEIVRALLVHPPKSKQTIITSSPWPEGGRKRKKIHPAEGGDNLLIPLEVIRDA